MERQLELLSRDATQHNVYFATLPDVAAVARIDGTISDLRRRLGLAAMPIPSERLHVSLLSVGGFSGSCPPAIIDAAMTAAGTISVAPFRVEFDRIASFSGGRGKRAIVLTGEGEGIDGLEMLGCRLSQAMAVAGVRLPQQPASTPHLTMMYENQDCGHAIEPIGWTVNRFVLVDSLFGHSRHVHLGEWQF